MHISPLADRARALRDESGGCDDRGVTLMGPEALSEGGIDAGRPRGLSEKVSSASGPPSVALVRGNKCSSRPWPS